MIRPVLAGAAAAAVLLVTTAAPALAGSGLAMAVDVNNSQVTQRSTDGTTCEWEVSSDVTVVNLTGQPQTFTDVEASVNWTGPGGASGVVSDVTQVDDGGLQSGDTLGPHDQQTFSPFVTDFDIPCAATSGDLAVEVSTSQGSGSGDAPFLQNGTAVPVVAVGAILLTAVAGAGLLAQQLRRRRTPAGGQAGAESPHAAGGR